MVVILLHVAIHYLKEESKNSECVCNMYHAELSSVGSWNLCVFSLTTQV